MDTQIVLLIILVVVSAAALLITKFMPTTTEPMLNAPMSGIDSRHNLDVAYTPIREFNKETTTPSSNELTQLTSRVSDIESKLAEQLSLSSVNKEQLKYLTSNANRTN